MGVDAIRTRVDTVGGSAYMTEAAGGVAMYDATKVNSAIIDGTFSITARTLLWVVPLFPYSDGGNGGDAGTDFMGFFVMDAASPCC